MAGLISMVVISLFVFFFRPWFHWLFMFLYAQPWIWFSGLVLIALGLVLARLTTLGRPKSMRITVEGSTHESQYSPLGWSLFLIWVLLLAPGLISASILRSLRLADGIHPEFIQSLPDSAESIRLIPMDVAKRYATDSLQLSQYRLGTENISMVDGRLAWVFPLTPDGVFLRFTRENKGMIWVDATIGEKNSQIVWDDLAIGEGMLVTDNLWWQLRKNRYFLKLDDPFYVTWEGRVYTVVSATRYNYRFFWGLPYTVPEFAGVFLVSPQGEVRWLDVDEAQTEPILLGHRLYPEDLTRQRVEAYRYHLGVRNRFFIHKDQIKVVELGEGNRQPFLIQTVDGLEWFVATEPHGRSHGIFKIFLVNARTGHVRLYQLPAENNLTGPVRSADYVRQENPTVDWDRFQLVEPLPFMRNGTLYWKLAVVPQGSAGIAYQAFVDSRSNQVTTLRSNEEIYAFVGGRFVDQTVLAPVATEDGLAQIRQRLEELLRLVDEMQK